VAGFVHALPAPPAVAAPAAPAGLALPAPRTLGPTALEAALAQRRSLRSFAATPLTVAEAGQLLWAAQGQTGAEGRRTAPSAGATYPLVLYLVAGRVDGVAAGVYRYRPQGHSLVPVASGDVLARVAAAARGQSWLARAPALVVVAAEPSRTAARYGARADRYVAIETGAAAQNLLLQATALGLGGTLVGAFDEAALRAAWPWVPQEQSLLVVALGRAP
jgi:SagB-type dehydrogenase family enzyme